MVKTCCVKFCKSESYAGCGISFHIFPKDEDSKKKWLDIVPSSQKITKNSVVCSKHFKKEDFVEKNSRQLLKAHVMPSIFPSGLHILCKGTDEQFEDNLNVDEVSPSHGLSLATLTSALNNWCKICKVKWPQRDSDEVGESAASVNLTYQKGKSSRHVTLDAAEDMKEDVSETSNRNLVIESSLQPSTSRGNLRRPSDNELDYISDTPREVRLRRKLKKSSLLNVKHRKIIRTLKQKIRRLQMRNKSLKTILGKLNKNSFVMINNV